VKTIVESLEGNKVKIAVEVDEPEFEKALDAAFKRIAREVRIPGFRPGKAPRRLLEARIGTEVARQEALREALPQYYARAVMDNEVDTIAPPEIDITAGEESGPLAFDAVVEVRPRVSVPGYENLRVTLEAPTVDDEEINNHLDRLRQQFAELAAVEREAGDGDHVSIDIQGSIDGEPAEGLTADDYLYEVGSGAVVPEVDEHLRGASAGDVLEFDAPMPGGDEDDDDDDDDDDEPTVLSFRIEVKEVKEKVLPDLDDAWAAEASEFSTVDELRADIRERLGTIKRAQAQLALRDQVLEALTALVDEEAPEPLIQAEVERRAQELIGRLQAQGAGIEDYLQATGRSQEDLVAELREGAVRAVKADLALRAVVDAQDIEASDEEVDAEVARLAERLGEKPAAVRRQLERAEQMPAVRSDVRKGKALEWLVDHVEIVDEDGNPIDRSELEAPPTGDAGTEGDEGDDAETAADTPEEQGE
jgi:trigger factor